MMFEIERVELGRNELRKVDTIVSIVAEGGLARKNENHSCQQ